MITFCYLSLAAIIALLAFIALQPSEFSIERSVIINAPAAKVFPFLNSQSKMETWSPWAKLDPTMQSTLSGPPEGVGAAVTWAGNRKVGKGTSTIIDSKPHSFIKTRLDFLEPMKATNMAEFRLKEAGEQTEITWAMSGRNGYIAKAIGLFFNFDKMVGGQFESGLQDLKALVET